MIMEFSIFISRHLLRQGNALLGALLIAVLAVGCSHRSQDDATVLKDADYDAYIAACDRSDYQVALAKAKALVDKFSKNGIAWNCLGYAREQTGDEEGSFKAFKHAVKVAPTFPKAWYNLGVAWGKRKNQKEEMRCYEMAVNLDPKYAKAWHNIASIHLERGNISSAYATYKRAIRLDRSLIEPGLFVRKKQPVNEEECEFIKDYSGWQSFAPPPPQSHITGRPPEVRFLIWNDEDIAATAALKAAVNQSSVLQMGVIRKQDIQSVPVLQVARERYARERNNQGIGFEQVQAWDQAEKAYRDALRFLPDEAMIWNNLGMTSLAQRNYKEAIYAFSEAMRLSQKDLIIQHNLAIAHAAWGEVLVNRGADLAALRELNEALRLKRDLTNVRFTLASLLRRRGGWSEALEQYQKLVREIPDSGQAWQGMAACNMRTGQEDKGLEALAMAVRFSPEAYAIKYWYGMELIGLHREKEAIPLLENYLKISPSNGRAWYGLGVARAHLTRWNEAIVAFNNAVITWSGSAEPRLALASAYIANHQPLLAVEVYLKMLESDPDNITLLKSLGTVYAMGKDWNQSWRTYERITELVPMDGDAWFKLGMALTSDGNWSYSTHACQQARENGVNSMELWNLMGVNFASCGQQVEALDAFEHALTLSPNNPWILFNTALTLHVLGRESDVQQIYAKLKNLNSQRAKELDAYLHQSRDEKRL